MHHSSNIIVEEVPLEEIIELRHTILREGLPRETANFDGDDEPTTHHVAALLGERIVGCGTILRRPFQGTDAWQVRGMAVATDMQGKGVGHQILKHLEAIARESGGPMKLWCNARTPAVTFYQKHGWLSHGTEFLVDHAGPHYVMSRDLET
jgi:GNAT superfamily N-acetyltransferase